MKYIALVLHSNSLTTGYIYIKTPIYQKLDMYIRIPICISELRYLHITTPICISDVGYVYQNSDIPYSRENNDRLFYSKIAHLCGTDNRGVIYDEVTNTVVQ